MVKRSTGLQSGRSKKLRKRIGTRKVGTSRLLKNFNIGDKVHLDLRIGYEPIPHGRYRGRTGMIIGRRGAAYIVSLMDGNKKRTLISHPVHLRPYLGGNSK